MTDNSLGYIDGEITIRIGKKIIKYTDVRYFQEILGTHSFNIVAGADSKQIEENEDGEKDGKKL
jgi:hypothetical protein